MGALGRTRFFRVVCSGRFDLPTAKIGTYISQRDMASVVVGQHTIDFEK